MLHQRNPLYKYISPDIDGIEHLCGTMIDQPAAHYMVAGDLKARIGHLHDFIPHDKVDFIFGENDNSLPI